MGGPLGRVRKTSPTTGIRFPDRPARSESLYRLSYPDPPTYRSIRNFHYMPSVIFHGKVQRHSNNVVVLMLNMIRLLQEMWCSSKTYVSLEVALGEYFPDICNEGCVSILRSSNLTRHGGTFLGAFAKIRKATIGFVVSVRPSA